MIIQLAIVQEYHNIRVRWTSQRPDTKGMERQLDLRWLDRDDHLYLIDECMGFTHKILTPGERVLLSVAVNRIVLIEHEVGGA